MRTRKDVKFKILPFITKNDYTCDICGGKIIAEPTRNPNSFVAVDADVYAEYRNGVVYGLFCTKECAIIWRNENEGKDKNENSNG